MAQVEVFGDFDDKDIKPDLIVIDGGKTQLK